MAQIWFSCSSAASGGMMITMRHLWCRVVPDCVCDRGVTSGAVVQLGVISVCNECTQFQFGSALQQLVVAYCYVVLLWFGGGSVVVQMLLYMV